MYCFMKLLVIHAMYCVDYVVERTPKVGVTLE